DASYQEQTGGREASPQPSGYQPSAPMAAPRVDETMELPIFRQVESVWFRARKPLPPPTEPGRSTSGTETVELATITSSGSYRATTAEDPDATTLLPLREPVGTVGDMGDPTGRNAANGDAMRGDTVQNAHTSASATTGPAAHEWRTAADEGWPAARAGRRLAWAGDRRRRSAEAAADGTTRTRWGGEDHPASRPTPVPGGGARAAVRISPGGPAGPGAAHRSWPPKPGWVRI